MKFYFFYFPAEVIRVIGNIAVRQQQATQLCLGRQPPLHWNDSWIVSTGLARKQRNFKRRKDKTKTKEGVGEGNNHWERNVLSTGAPANCLAHEFVGRVSRLLDLDPALPPQGCWHLSSPDDSSVWHGLFFFFPFLPAIAAFLPQRFPPYQKWPSYDGLASCECQTALWLFNEAIRHREPQLLLPLLVLK